MDHVEMQSLPKQETMANDMVSANKLSVPGQEGRRRAWIEILPFCYIIQCHFSHRQHRGPAAHDVFYSLVSVNKT